MLIALSAPAIVVLEELLKRIRRPIGVVGTLAIALMLIGSLWLREYPTPCFLPEGNTMACWISWSSTTHSVTSLSNVSSSS